MKITFKIEGTKANIDNFNENLDWRWLWEMAKGVLTQWREDDETLYVSVSSKIPDYLKELRGDELAEFENALSRGCKKFNVTYTKI